MTEPTRRAVGPRSLRSEPNRCAVGPFWCRFDPDGRPGAFYDLATGEAVA